MIHITVTTDGDIDLLEVSGHANARTEEGRIACAGVSAVYQTAVNGLLGIAEKHPDCVRVTRIDKR